MEKGVDELVIEVDARLVDVARAQRDDAGQAMEKR